MAFETKFFDDFANSTVDVKTDPGNGAITEPAGSSLIVSITAGDHAGWGAGTGNDNKGAPIAYEDLLDHITEHEGVLRFETRITDLTKTGNEIFSGLTVWKNGAGGTGRENAYLIGWYDANNYIYIYKMENDVGRTQLYAGSSVGDPSATPHIYRFYINLTDEKVVLNSELQAAWTLNPNSIGFIYSATDGASWGYPVQRELDFTPDGFGVYALNWSGGGWRGVDASFDYLKLEQDLTPQVWTGDGLGSAPKTLIDDRAEIAGAGGPQAHEGTSRGQRLAGSVSQPVSTDNRDVPKQLMEDQVATQDAAGAPEHQPALGLFSDTDKNLQEMQVGIVHPDLDYITEKDDGDANELLADTDTRAVLKVDNTVGGFGDPTSNNHWGAAADGKFYADGVECAPGVFGTLAGGFDHESWRNSEEEPLQLGKTTGSMSMTADDVATMVGTFNGYPTGPAFSSLHKWVLTGDFDIQLDFANLSASNTSYVLGMLATYNAGGAEGTNYVGIEHVRGRYEFTRVLNGAWAATATGGGNDTSGKIRLTRVGGLFRGYYWTGSWTEVGSGYTHALGGNPLSITIYATGTSGCVLSVDASNFTINSGTTSNRAGWYREASGDHRGTLAVLPASMGIVATQGSLELLDLATDKLWMRFLRGSLNALGAYQNERPNAVAWDDGLLLLAYGSDASETQEGGAIMIDFVLDSIRQHREAVSTICGSYHRGTRSRADGVIVGRNSGVAYSVDDDTWQIQDYRVWGVDLYRDSGFEYRAIATVEGMTVVKLTRWELQTALQRSTGTETTHMRWCLFDPSDGELFYMDDTTMHSRAKTGAGGWETVMDGGTFTAATTKALPGSRHRNEQYMAVRYGSYLFMPAVEGVYRIDWPSGSWTLFYGKPGSGATHEILPDGDVTALTFGNDGTYDMLAVGMRNIRWGGGQIVAVKLTDNTIYGLTPVAELETPRALGA